MTVAELIAKLQEFDPDTKVLYPAGECSNCVSIENVTEIKASFEKRPVYNADYSYTMVDEPVVVIGSYL